MALGAQPTATQENIINLTKHTQHLENALQIQATQYRNVLESHHTEGFTGDT